MRARRVSSQQGTGVETATVATSMRVLTGVALVAAFGFSIVAGRLYPARAQVPGATPVTIPSPTAPASVEDTIHAVPLLARFAADGTSLHSYIVPVHLTATLRKLVFSFRFRREGTVTFEQPNRLNASIRSVPKRYADVFGELGTPDMWPTLYDLQLVRTEFVDGRSWFELSGVPRGDSDVAHLSVRMSDETQPIEARWSLNSGWTITSTIELEPVRAYLLTKRERADIVGHGFRIHSEMVYGSYAINASEG
jgi:hypothetical protein